MGWLKDLRDFFASLFATGYLLEKKELGDIEKRGIGEIALYPEDIEKIAKAIGEPKADKLFDEFAKLQAQVAKLEAKQVAKEEEDKKRKDLEKELKDQELFRKSKLVEKRRVIDFKHPYKIKVVSSYLDRNDYFYGSINGNAHAFKYWAGLSFIYEKNGAYFSLRLSNKPARGHIKELAIGYTEQLQYLLDFNYVSSFNILRVNVRPDGKPIPQHIPIDPTVAIEQIKDSNSRRLLKLKLDEIEKLDIAGIKQAYITMYDKLERERAEKEDLQKKYEEVLEDRNTFASSARVLTGMKSESSANLARTLDMLKEATTALASQDSSGKLSEAKALANEMLTTGMVSKMDKLKGIGEGLVPTAEKEEEKKKEAGVEEALKELTKKHYTEPKKHYTEPEKPPIKKETAKEVVTGGEGGPKKPEVIK